ncbi:hypothetical protein EXIGLDRAFT_612594, partial [Exidia glandulosa HHB12029]
RVEELEDEIEALEEQLGDDVDAEKMVSRHITLLHEYNEAKDAGQVRGAMFILSDASHGSASVRWKLAALKQTTVRQMHQDYGLSVDD